MFSKITLIVGISATAVFGLAEDHQSTPANPILAARQNGPPCSGRGNCGYGLPCVNGRCATSFKNLKRDFADLQGIHSIHARQNGPRCSGLGNCGYGLPCVNGRCATSFKSLQNREESDVASDGDDEEEEE
ncbi:hypothetical protein MCOR25_010432 [Pyricularia grisea]|nr:hypothetical protein MCOR25_010432 [Pyricularia grisea]